METTATQPSPRTSTIEAIADGPKENTGQRPVRWLRDRDGSRCLPEILITRIMNLEITESTNLGERRIVATGGRHGYSVIVIVSDAGVWGQEQVPNPS